MGVPGAPGGSASKRRAARALRLLLLLVLALAAVEYLFGSIFDALPIRTYIYSPYNATPPTIRTNRTPYGSPTTSKRTPVTNKVENRTIANHTTSSNSSIKFLNATLAPVQVTMTVSSTKDTSNSLLINKIFDSIQNQTVLVEESKRNESESPLPVCEDGSDLGPVHANMTEIELSWIENQYPEVQRGGRYSPPNCTAKSKVAIIVPYRDRQQHLAIFLRHMHPFLMKQQLDYGIFIIEQSGNTNFNRAKLFNVGFAESQRLREGGWQCFIFHDIDLLPLDLRNLYTCPRQPRHMSAAIDQFKFKLPYQDIFGGVSALTREQFEKVNGFSNKYWGWGGEDDDMSSRLRKMKYHIARYKMSIARYAMLVHKKSSPNPKRYQLLSQTGKTYMNDGISTLEYELVAITQYHLFTHVLVNIEEKS